MPSDPDASARVSDKPRPVEPDMLYEVHPNLFVEGVAGASIGDKVLVTDNGPEILTRHERGLIEF